MSFDSAQCHNVLTPQPLPHPEPSFVGLSRSGRVSRVEKVHTGHFDLSLMALECCGDHPFADVLCLNDLSLPSLVQEYTNSMLSSEATSAHVHMTAFRIQYLFSLVFMLR